MGTRRKSAIGIMLVLMLLMAACTAAAQGQPPAKGSTLLGEPVNLRFALHNPTDRPLYVLTWHTSLEGMAGESMQVTRDGAKLPYQGTLAKRGDPVWLDRD